MKSIHLIFNILRNKFFLSFTIFMVWILFFDDRDLFTQKQRKAELQQLVATKTFYENEIFKAKKELTDIQTSTAALEKLAREKYKMKMENEELFLIEQSEKRKNN